MSENDSPKIIMMGPVGSGKTTQAELLAEHLKIPHLDTGEMLRELAITTPLGKRVHQYIERGELIPDDWNYELLKQEISNPKYKNGFVVNGTPRTLHQAQQLPFEPDVVVYLKVSDEENKRRLLLRKRHDDEPELIEKRFEIYHRETEPIINFYRQTGKLLEVDGERPVEVIFQDIVDQLKKKEHTSNLGVEPLN